MYAYDLPDMDKITRLAKLVNPFPATARRIAKFAKHYGFSRDVLDFLHYFHPREKFESRADFVTRCDEMELFIREEREMPIELLRSPQG